LTLWCLAGRTSGGGATHLSNVTSVRVNGWQRRPIPGVANVQIDSQLRCLGAGPFWADFGAAAVDEPLAARAVLAGVMVAAKAVSTVTWAMRATLGGIGVT
jgi:hypothetical protein